MTSLPYVAVTLARPLHVSKVGQSKEKGKTKQATLISDFHVTSMHMEVRALFGLFVWRGVNIDDVTIHPSRGSRIDPTLKVCKHNRVAHASHVIRYSLWKCMGTPQRFGGAVAPMCPPWIRHCSVEYVMADGVHMNQIEIVEGRYANIKCYEWRHIAAILSRWVDVVPQAR